MKLLLADDHPLFVEGLQYLLETHGVPVAGIAKDGTEAIEKARFLKPDIILMDIKMPVCSGIDALKVIKAEMPDIKIIMLTASEKDEELSDAVKNGASGYLLKSTNAKELLEVLSDSFPLSKASQKPEQLQSTDAQDVSQAFTAPEETKDSKLTDRQLEILELAANGTTYKEAGEILGLSERTLKYHMNRITELLHLENRAQAIAYAARIGLVKDK